ncbi:hypothetical protein Tco_0104902 [Tanacetum coccineum]
MVAYFLDSCNLGSRIVDFYDTPIVIDKHVRAVTFAFHKGETVATTVAKESVFGSWRRMMVWWRDAWRSHVGVASLSRYHTLLSYKNGHNGAVTIQLLIFIVSTGGILSQKLVMHQLLQDMGRKIVYEESKDPANAVESGMMMNLIVC